MQDILQQFDEQPLRTKEASNLRAVAFIIDFILQLILAFLYIRFAGREVSPNQWKVEGAATLPIVATWFAYFILLEGFYGRTLGKALTGIKTVSVDGSSLSIGQAFTRRLGDFIDIYCCFGIIGFIILKSSANNQRLGDRWANTTVVKV